MKLSKSDALLIHATLYMAYNTEGALSGDYRDQIGDIIDDLHDFLSADTAVPDTSHDHCGGCHEDVSEDDLDSEDEDEEEFEDEDEEEDPEPEEFITTKAASDLPPLTVVSPVGKKITLEFEDVGEKDTVDVLLDEGGVIIDSISCVVLTQEEINLFDGEGWHDFKVKKIPKQWTKVFNLGKATGFEAGDEE